MVQLPPEIYSAIVSYASTRDLLALSRTSKAFQRAAEPKIYECMILRDAESTFLGCHAILARNAFRGPYVRRIFIYQDARRATARNNLSAAPPQFWLVIQHALTKTENLETFCIHDPTISHSWILNHTDFKFQLREATLRLPWDSNTVSFLQTQRKLLILSVADARDDGPLFPLPPGALPMLEVFSGPALVAAELLGSPLKRVQMTTDEETAPLVPTIVADLGKIMKTLRTLSILGLPEEFVLETVHLVATSVLASQLRYLGLLRLPMMREWDLLHRSLMKLSVLVMLEVEVTQWDPAPNEGLQRMILHEFRVFCPSLQQVVFWHSLHRFHWYSRDGQWHCLHTAGRHPANDNQWRIV
ncbi:hypothetical protein ONZ51_g1198 [Trametes cubensis]|uniref:F-box domain-containing protein n=1 Tax=Trametes cubensis TaxID=1111947 RepID=A0AAD7U4A4_9APHY|nr:hypothetical protein ONZ51_g1198 [Trametes cubensis]